jgi:hypothetical protein
MNTLDEESSVATTLLAGKTVSQVMRNRPNEMLVEFSDGTRLYVDVTWRKRTPIFLHFPWSGATCNWSPIGTVMLNPERPATTELQTA